MSKRLVLEAAASMYKDAGNGFVNALDDIRQKVVEQGWFGQPTTASIASGGIHGPVSRPETTIHDSQVLSQLDPRGPIPEAAPTQDWRHVSPEERAGMAELYGRYQEFGGGKLLEFENSMDAAYHGWFEGSADGGHRASVVEVYGDGNAEFSAASIADMDVAEL